MTVALIQVYDWKRGSRGKNQNLQTLVLYHMRLLGFEDMLHIKENRHLKHDDAFNRTWPPILLSIDKCCQVTSLSIERTDHHVLLKASSCLRCLMLFAERQLMEL